MLRPFRSFRYAMLRKKIETLFLKGEMVYVFCPEQIGLGTDVFYTRKKVHAWTNWHNVILSIELGKTAPILTVIVGVNLQAVYDALCAYEKTMSYSDYQSALKDVIMECIKAQRIQTRAMILATGAQLIED